MLDFKLPFEPNKSLYWIIGNSIKKVWFKGIRQDKGYKPQIICRYEAGCSAKECAICNVDSFGITLFDSKEEAEKNMKGRR
jgi:hypothetical protein